MIDEKIGLDLTPREQKILKEALSGGVNKPLTWRDFYGSILLTVAFVIVLGLYLYSTEVLQEPAWLLKLSESGWYDIAFGVGLFGLVVSEILGVFEKGISQALLCKLYTRAAELQNVHSLRNGLEE